MDCSVSLFMLKLSLESVEVYVDFGFEIMDGKFGWDNDKIVFYDIDICILYFSLIIVIGFVVFGKLMFCKVLLGEVFVFGGKFYVVSCFCKIGYCDQIFYFLNVIIRENIIGFDVFN